MNKRKWAIILCVSLFAVLALYCGNALRGQILFSMRADADLAQESLRWTMIGAIGSWAGSVFGALALIISLFAFWLPQRVKIEVSISCGFTIGEENESIGFYNIRVKNTGMRPVTVENVYLHFGPKENGDIFIGLLNWGTVFQALNPILPKRVEQGTSFDYYLDKERLDAELSKLGERRNLPHDSPLKIRVDEVMKGGKYYKTTWTLRSFIR